jgi:integrase
MPTAKLTEKRIAQLKAPDPSGRQVLWWDDQLKGFGILCSGITNSKAYVVQRALVNGRTRRVTIASVAEIGLREARERAARLLLDMRNGNDPKAGRAGGAPTLRQTLSAYLAARNSLAPRSKESYRAIVERHLAPWLDQPLSAITPDMAEIRHREIQASVEAAGRHSGNATANAAMVALRTVWNFALDRDASLPANPVRRLKRSWFPVHRREGHVRAEDLPKFYAAVCALPNPVARDYLFLLLFTGLRRREAAGLTWDDVDLVHRVIRLPAARTKAGRKLDLPMSDYVRDLLIARRLVGNDNGWVFPSGNGHITEPNFPLRQVAEECGIKVSAHDLRRTYVTVAESCDISPLALAALVNHSVGRSVTSGYVQMAMERLREPAQRVADKMQALCRVEIPSGENLLRLG